MDNIKLKKIIFKRLYEDLSHVEIIPYSDSIWFIDREKEYWYFEYHKSGRLYWRWSFFINFFRVFSMYEKEFQSVISEWVEEVLNCKVVTPQLLQYCQELPVEEVLNCKVVTPQSSTKKWEILAEVVLNHKVVTPIGNFTKTGSMVEEVLNCNVKYVPSSECSLRSD